MTISKDIGNQIIFECDDCGKKFEAKTGRFEYALALLKGAGWRVFKDRFNDWCHICKECKRCL